MTRLDMATARAAIRLAAERIEHEPPTDYGEGYTLHQVFGAMVLDVIGRLHDPDVIARLERLRIEEAAR